MLLTPARRKLSAPALLLEPRRNQDYFDRVIAADRGAEDFRGLETNVIKSFGRCLDGLHNAGYLGVSNGVFAQAASVIKASCFLCGARTLTGCLTPLAADMPTPTNINFVSNDYNRKTGLGDPANTSKYVALNYNNNLPPQNDIHQAVWVSTAATGAAGQSYIGAGLQNSGTTHIGVGPTQFLFFRNRSANAYVSTAFFAAATGFIGQSRSSSADYITRYGATTFNQPQTSQAPYIGDTLVFARSSVSPPTSFCNGRIAVASIGLSLDQVVYESILTTFMASITASIS